MMRIEPPEVPAAAAEEWIDGIAQAYAHRGARESLRAVRALQMVLPAPAKQIASVAVVGTNGKTSTATYFARLLSAIGLRVGLYTSPHLHSWTERVRIDDLPIAMGDLVRSLSGVYQEAMDLGDHDDIRFFDVLTLAAERLIAERAQVGVFEAGVGGRLDAVRLLKPELVVLTGIGIDHSELLGESPREILREKLLVAPPGARVVSWRLPGDLTEFATSLAREHGLRIYWTNEGDARGVMSASELPKFQNRALWLSRVALHVFQLANPALMPQDVNVEDTLGGISREIPGRYELGMRGDTQYLLDAAHNESAWDSLLEELMRSGVPTANKHVLVVSLSEGRDVDALAGVVRRIPGKVAVIATEHRSRPAVAPALLAEQLQDAAPGTKPVPNLEEAIAQAFDRAAASDANVVIFGSTYLAGEARRVLTVST